MACLLHVRLVIGAVCLSNRRAERFKIQYLASDLKAPCPHLRIPSMSRAGLPTGRCSATVPTRLTVLADSPWMTARSSGRQHLRMAKAAAAGESETWRQATPLATECLGDDLGKDQEPTIADLLIHWYKAVRSRPSRLVDHTPTEPPATARWPHSTISTSVSTSPMAQTRCSRTASPGPSPTANSPTPTTVTASSR